MKKIALFLGLMAIVAPVADAGAQNRQQPQESYDYPTMWVPVGKSMTQLLDEGWRITGYDRVVTENFSNNFIGYTFILTDGQKYIFCGINDPAMGDAESWCRALN